jgi:hypothetical protein
MFAMCTDNIFWIGTSPEYRYFKGYSLKEKIKYIILYRIKTVITSWRDIIPAIITATILSILW